jgi:hypothetical protein
MIKLETMNKLFFFLLMFVTTGLYAQLPVATKPDVDAKFPESEGPFELFLMEKLEQMSFPEANSLPSHLFITFLIKTNGAISAVRVTSGFEDCEPCRTRVEEAVSSSPSWIPAELHGKPVEQKLRYPIPLSTN